MLRWIVVGLVALAALFFAQPDQAQAAVEEYLGTNHRQDGILDFNGDGKSDIFRTDGISWYVSYGGTSTWAKLRYSPWLVSDGLCFGDFNGDGITDVFGAGGAGWGVSYGGTSGWSQINTYTVTPPNLALGDFNADGVTDIFYPNGTSWYVSYGGMSAWTKINTSGYRLDDLALADLNGDGRTDVFRALPPEGQLSDLLFHPGQWYVSYGGTGSWTHIRTSNYGKLGSYALMPEESDFGFADLNNDGKTDVFRATGTVFYISSAGTGSWTLINNQGEPHQLHFGDLDGNGWTDVFKPTILTPGGWKVWFNHGTSMQIEYIYPTGPPPDKEPPVISNVQVQSLTPTSAVMTWTTDEPATSRVWFGVTKVLNQSVAGSTLTSNHQLALTIPGLTELIPGTVYHYVVESTDASGNTVHVSGTFTTPAAPPPPVDTTPPIISAVQAIDITPTSATITWTTDELSDSRVEWGPTTSYGFLVSEGDLVTAHSRTLLDKLTPDTLYHYRVLSRDAAGNLATSPDHTFMTSDSADTTLPIISAVQVINITPTSATVIWTTDEAASSRVKYGLTDSYGSITARDSTLVTAHSTTLEGLTPDTLYHFEALSRDLAGNTAGSADYTFTTNAEADLPTDDPLFTDVPEGHAYFDAIQYMAEADMLHGYPQPDGTAEFRPANNLLRAQFAKLVCGAFQIPVSESLVTRFADLGPEDPADLYPHDYVEAAANEGITKGKTSTNFEPWTAVTRAQMVTMVVRAAQARPWTRTGAGLGLLTPPADYEGTFGEFSPNHQENMRIAEYNHLLAGIVGFGPSWNPWDPASRGEVAQVLVNWIQPWAPPGG